MKGKLIHVVLAGAFASVGLVAFGYTNAYPYEVPETDRDPSAVAMHCEVAQPGMTLEVGKWYTNFTVCKEYADKNGIPLVAVWSNSGCVHCFYTDASFLQPSFLDWKATHNEGQVIYCFMAGGHDVYDQWGSDAANWMWYGGGKTLNAYPFVVLWWKAKNVNERYTGDQISGTTTLAPSSYPTRVKSITAKMTNAFAGWVPEPPYAGGTFANTNALARAEAEAGTTSVAIDLVRTSTKATNQVMTISAPGKTTANQTITWAANVTNQTVTISSFNTKWFVEGKAVTLKLLDADKTVKSTQEIPCVASANSASNPDFKGCSDFGVWTMDLDAAKTKVRTTSGSAYTLVAVQGALWCPDCANVERNFLDVKDGSGNNRLAAWAKSKNIALVSIDIPNFKSASVDCASPSLLKRTAYQTTLGRIGEWPQSGADGSLTNAQWRSGLGYLTRKNVTAAQAEATLKRNHDLVTKNTDEGGFHRPEDTNANRTGVPIFVLLRKDGTVAARLTRMASVSPMAADKANFDNYLKRFEEMLWIAENNATEIGNNAPSADAVPLRANGGAGETATLCHADQVDTFALVGVGGNALQKIMVKGESEAEVKISLVTKNALGQVVELATSEAGRISDGISLEYTFTQAGSYFAQVKAKDITSEAFKLESPKALNFQEYTISGTVVAVPQEDAATANAPVDSDELTIRLVEGTVYRMIGLVSCAQLEPAVGASGFYRATASVDATAKVAENGGSLTYQIWKPGTVGFDKTSRSVKESVCDLDGKPLEIKLTRTGGKSGEITVKVDTNLVAIADYRYDFTPTNVVWRDGDMSDKTVYLMVNNDLLYDGKGVIELALTVASSTAGDVKVADGKGTFTLTVTEDDVQAPGKAYITRAEPEYNERRVVYARAGEGMKFYAKRIDGNDGLVAAVLTSSVKGTVFTTEDPRDLEDVAQEYPELKDLVPEGAKFLYWSTREDKEKYVQVTGIPAGKTATIRFSPVSPLGTVSASNTVTIISIADGAPGFDKPEDSVALVRNVEFRQEIGLVDVEDLSRVTFTKLSGTLPAGLSVGKTDVGGAKMVLSGTPTARVGSYQAVYQVRETRGGKLVPGMTIAIAFEVADVTQGSGGSPALNPSVAKTRSFTDIPLVYEAEGVRQLAGLLQVTIPATGRVSARYTGAAGAVSLSAKQWINCHPNGTLSTSLASSKGDYTLELEAKPDGAVGLQLKDPAYGEPLTAEIDGKVWSKTDSATPWKGYYTVAIRQTEGGIVESRDGIAPTGFGYLTLKMNTASACNSGTFTVAGALPNGTRVSGSFRLSRTEAGSDTAALPVFVRSSKDVFAAVAGILADDSAEKGTRTRRCVESFKDFPAVWAHTERADYMADFSERLTLHGSYYDSKEDLGGCCAEFYETTSMKLYCDTLALIGVTVGKDKLTLDKENPYGVTLSFSRSTGVVTGSCKDPADPIRRLSYTGVVVNGWGEGCGCDPLPAGSVLLPFLNGCGYRTVTLTDPAARVTFGCSTTIDK